MTAQDIFFWALAGASIGTAVAVVMTKSIFRAAILLATCFLSIAGLFALMHADFLAVVQVLIYVGAISVLLAFAALLTRDAEGGNLSNRLWAPALVGSGLFLTFLVVVVLGTDWSLMELTLSAESLAKMRDVLASTPTMLAGLLLNEWALPFEVASVLLLAAIIGALVLVRERHP